MIYGKRDVPQGLQFSPDYKQLPIENYSRIGRIGAYTFLRPRDAVAATVISRRGCRAQCSFCSVRSVSGAGVRIRDHISVVDEIQRYKEKYGVSHVMWLDDDLFYDNDLSVNLFKELASRNLNITWDASNGIIAAALNTELLDACVASGCIGFNIGIESGNPEILRHMRKPGTVEKFIGAAKLLQNYPQIFTKGFLIVGYPGESLSAIQDSINLAKAMDLDWYPSQILTPMPGTPVHQLMLDQEKVAGAPTEVLDTSKRLGKGRTFSVGVTGEIRKREMNEKKQTRAFVDAFDTSDLSRVPEREEISDIWLTMDYRINYEPILLQPDKKKLEKKKIMLQEIGERMTFDNPLGTLFYGVVLERLGQRQEAKIVIQRAEQYLNDSEFWKVRFKGLGIDKVLEEYKAKVGATRVTHIIELSGDESLPSSAEDTVPGALPGRAGTLPN
jgi:pyruvate-formate lyase-activating enzyme